MYKTRDQTKPVYDAKGIETVQRDGIPATVKMLEKTIQQYVLHQFRKLQAGSVCIRDLTFAKEFCSLQGYRPTACVPALKLTRMDEAQERAEKRAQKRI